MVDGIRSQVVAPITKGRKWNRQFFADRKDLLENADSRISEDSGSLFADAPLRSMRNPVQRPEVFHLSETESEEAWSSPAANHGPTHVSPKTHRRRKGRHGKSHSCAPDQNASASCAYAAIGQRPGQQDDHSRTPFFTSDRASGEAYGTEIARSRASESSKAPQTMPPTRRSPLVARKSAIGSCAMLLVAHTMCAVTAGHSINAFPGEISKN